MKTFFLVQADEISGPTLREFLRVGCYTFSEAVPDEEGDVVFDLSGKMDKIKE